MYQHEYFGHMGQVTDPFGFFEEQDYVICRGATDLNKIDSLVEYYNRRISNSKRKYLRQGAQWEANEKTDAGGVANGFLNPHSYERGQNRKFADRILTLLDSSEIQDALLEISNRKERFMLVQTMLFDQSVTPPHQDWIFLDSRPNGHMIAAWIALEDIHPDGIRFFVYPGTQNFVPKAMYTGARGSSTAYHQDFMAEVDSLVAANTYQMYAPPLKKGDIFFWGSRLIHGSIAGENTERRRRSVAAHFVPNGLKYGNLEEDIELKTKAYSSNLTYAYQEWLDKGFHQANSTVPRINPRSIATKLMKKLTRAS